jgi:hypothetical protein
MSANKNNRNKKSDNLRDVILSKKTPAQADFKELFQDRTDNDTLTFKKGVGDFIKLLSKEQIETLIEAIPTPPPGGSDYTETIVNISSAQILAMGTTPIELLPAPGVDKYYDIDKIVLEYTHVTTGYNNGGILINNLGGSAWSLTVSNEFLDWGNNTFIICDTNSISQVDLNSGTIVLNPNDINIALTLSSNSNPTDGDGTLRVKIYHKTITFGA